MSDTWLQRVAARYSCLSRKEIEALAQELSTGRLGGGGIHSERLRMHIGRLLARIGQLEQWFDDMQHGRVVERFREAIEGLPPVLPGSPLILDEALAQIGQLRQRVAQLEAQRGFFPRVWGWWQHARLAGGE